MYLQEKDALIHNRNESLAGEILCHGHYYAERLTREGHRAPWNWHTGCAGRRHQEHFRDTQMYNTPRLGASGPAGFTAVRPFDFSSHILPQGGVLL